MDKISAAEFIEHLPPQEVRDEEGNITKQDEIREELAIVLAHIDGRYWNDLTVVEASDYIKKTERVVIKVDRELPNETLVGISYDKMRRVLNAGYEAVEPLIKEVMPSE